MAGAVGAASGFAGSAMAGSVGVNFVGGGGGAGGASVTGTAGFIAQGNWNNESGNANSAGAAVQTDGGAAAGTVSWNSSNTWDSGQAGQNQNGNLLQGYLDDNPSTPTTITVTGLPASIAGTGSTPYAVYLYIAGDTVGRGGTYTVNGQSVVLTDSGAEGDGLFKLATPAVDSTGTGAVAGNYYVFPNVTGTTLSITTAPLFDTTPRSPIDGFQVVGLTPEPAGIGLIGAAAIGLLARRRRARGA
jgi:hypothetical protein